MQYGDLCDINELRQFIAYIAAYTSKSLQAFNNNIRIVFSYADKH